MLNQEHLEILVKPFGFSACEMEFLQASQNIVYRASKGSKKFIIRISKKRYRTQDEVEAELLWIRYLAQKGINACQPVPALDGTWCHSSQIDGAIHLVTCFEHAPGLQISRKDADISTFEKLGRLTGEMHQAARTFQLEGLSIKRLPWDKSRLLNEDFSDQEKHISEDFEQSVRSIVDEQSNAHKDHFSFGVIHSDLNCLNLFQSQAKLWVFDFDNCEYGYFIQDLATILWDTIYCKELNKFADDGLNARIQPLWEALLKGYAETGSLREIKLSHLKNFFLLREAIIYVHFHQILEIEELDASFQQGLQVMLKNVEQRKHQVDFSFISKDQSHIKIT